MGSQSHKNILILGATSDIAIAIAKEYAKQGDHLILAGRNIQLLEEIASDISIRYETSVVTKAFDALDYSSHNHFFSVLDPSPDMVFCVFGYLGDQDKGQATWDEARSIIETNYTGAVSILNVVADHMEKRRNGVIVGISSVAGDRGKMTNYLYGSAKAGFTAYLSGLRNRLFHSQVHVLTVKPGFVATEMTSHMDLPAPLTATPEQVAKQTVGAVKSQKNVIYTLKRWWLIMFIIKSIPEFIFKRLKL